MEKALLNLQRKRQQRKGPPKRSLLLGGNNHTSVGSPQLSAKCFFIMIFKVVEGEDIRSTNNSIDSIGAFKGQKDNLLKFVFLMYDYDSPFRTIPVETRHTYVLPEIGIIKESSITTFMSRNKALIKKVKDAFMKLQFDEDHETLISMRMTISNWNKLLRKDAEELSDKDQALVQKIFDKMPVYVERKNKLAELVGHKEPEDKEDEDEMSTLERVNSRS